MASGLRLEQGNREAIATVRGTVAVPACVPTSAEASRASLVNIRKQNPDRVSFVFGKRIETRTGQSRSDSNKNNNTANYADVICGEEKQQKLLLMFCLQSISIAKVVLTSVPTSAKSNPKQCAFYQFYKRTCVCPVRSTQYTPYLHYYAFLLK